MEKFVFQNNYLMLQKKIVSFISIKRVINANHLSIRKQPLKNNVYFIE